MTGPGGLQGAGRRVWEMDMSGKTAFVVITVVYLMCLLFGLVKNSKLF